jgi:AcrR family transcriptional regulator
MTAKPTAKPATGRAATRMQLERDIVRLGREQLSTLGAPARSLRAIARDLGMVSSAVYRYVASRDELLTLLVIDAYSELADHVVQALDAMPSTDDVSARLLTIARAVRSWAVAEPARFALIYGSPVPGYEAPPEQTTEPGTRVVALMLTALAEVPASARMSERVAGRLPTSVSHGFDALRSEFGLDIDDPVLVVATCVWSLIIGAVSLEVFGQYGTDTFDDPGALFDLQMSAVLSGLLRLPD